MLIETTALNPVRMLPASCHLLEIVRHCLSLWYSISFFVLFTPDIPLLEGLDRSSFKSAKPQRQLGYHQYALSPSKLIVPS